MPLSIMEKYGFTWGNIQSIATLLVIIALAIGRTMWTAAEVKKQVDKIEIDLQSHISSQTLHRTPDSEARWSRVEKQLDRIEIDVATLTKGKQ